MRIIAGTKRGMKLLSPKTDVSRPITDRVKESLFSVLFKYGLPTGKRVADLFCGVGSIGLEALSRGAAFAAFVERDPSIVAVLERNIDKTGFVRQSRVMRTDAFKNGASRSSGEPPYDFVSIDPPYAQTVCVDAQSRLAGLFGVLADQTTPDAIVTVRTQRGVELLDDYGCFRCIERRQWSSMIVTILQKTPL